MSRMTRIIQVNPANLSFTAQVGLQFIDASRALREHDLQFMTNIENGNKTLGSAACCHYERRPRRHRIRPSQLLRHRNQVD
jgi:hypothetical protein